VPFYTTKDGNICFFPIDGTCSLIFFNTNIRRGRKKRRRDGSGKKGGERRKGSSKEPGKHNHMKPNNQIFGPFRFAI
jgi:hypothetical protein